MQNEMLQKIFNSLEVAKWFAGIIGTLFVFSGGLIVYIFTSHKRKNEDEHKVMSKSIGTTDKKADENGKDISKIKGSLGIN